MNLTGMKNSSRSDEVNVAVGFNPRLADQAALAVAERRLKPGVLSNPSSVATRRHIVRSLVIRGLKPAATITTSLREAAPQGSWSQCARGRERRLFMYRSAVVQTWIIGSIAVAGLLWMSVGAAQLDWHGDGAVRWVELELPAQGKAGFTQMLAE